MSISDGPSLQLVVYPNAAMELEKERPEKQGIRQDVLLLDQGSADHGEWQESKTLIEQDTLKELRMNGLANEIRNP